MFWVPTMPAFLWSMLTAALLLIISGWPGTATGVLGLIVGANLVSSGLGITMAALTARSSVKAVASPAR
jgi:hypothetical protein